MPKNIRCVILELLLVYGNVAVSPDRAIKARFPKWDFKRPEWALRAVNRQMRLEADGIVFSTRNTFFMPLGWQSHYLDLWPPVRKLDMAFDMRDFSDSTGMNLAIYRRDKAAFDAANGEGAFDQLNRNDRWDMLHETQNAELIHSWLAWGIPRDQMDLDLLTMDFTNLRCAAGCCRLLPVVEAIHDKFLHRWPKRIDIVGAEASESAAIVRAFETGSHTEPTIAYDSGGEDWHCPKGRVFFVERDASLDDRAPPYSLKAT